MTRKRSAGLTLLLTTDGSSQAHDALAVAAKGPWPETAKAHLVLARGGYRSGRGRLTCGFEVSREWLTSLSNARYRGPVALFATDGPT